MILDIPFECLPIQLLAQLSTLNKLAAERKQREFLTRNVGKELYNYLCSTPKYQRIHKIEQEMNTRSLWRILHSLHGHLEFSFIPINTPLRVEMNSTRYHENMKYVFYTNATLHFDSLVPTILCNHDVPSSSQENMIKTISHKLHNIIYHMVLPYVGDDHVEISWSTSPISLYMIDFQHECCYRVPYFSVYWNDGGIDYRPSHNEIEIVHGDEHIHNIVNTIVEASA